MESVTVQVRTEYGHLSAEQLNWTPAEGRWSIAQCLDHLITINRLYFPLLTALSHFGRGIAHAESARPGLGPTRPFRSI